MGDSYFGEPVSPDIRDKKRVLPGSGHGADKPNKALHPNRGVSEGRFLPSAPDTHTTTPEAAAAYASNNLSRQDLLSQIANHKGPKPNWMYEEMGYD